MRSELRFHLSLAWHFSLWVHTLSARLDSALDLLGNEKSEDRGAKLPLWVGGRPPCVPLLSKIHAFRPPTCFWHFSHT